MKQRYEMEGYTLHVIPSKKFKNITISLKLKNLLQKETTTIRTLLSFMFTAGTEEYPSTQAFSKHLEDMYGAKFGSNIGTKGKTQIINLTSVCINEEYLPYKEALLEEQIKIMNDVLLHLNTTNNMFDQKSFEIKKKELKERLRANNDDKFTYALEKLFQYMGEDDFLGISSTGYLEEVDKLTNEEVYNYLQTCLKEDQKHVYVVGDVDENIVEIFKKYMHFSITNEDNGSSLTYQSKKTEVLEIIEKQDITQSKLNLGYTINCDFINDNHYAFTVFNAIFGGFSQSRLFKVVREENSLCYYVSSSYDAFNGVMIVNAGIEGKDYEKTCQLIAQELENMKQGKFQDEEIIVAKKMLTNALTKANDEPISMIALAFNRDIVHKKETNEEYLEKLMNVTKEEIIDVARAVALDTIFLLTEGAK
ncbi:MAG: EF-P 5-aminopentanol modification-associated protein YfmF [Coprobacillaceae bacterium]